MTAQRYRKKPVVVDAMLYEGSNRFAVLTWIWENDGHAATGDTGIVIPTLEGDMIARPGDWVIRGVKGEFYPCKEDIFAATYETA